MKDTTGPFLFNLNDDPIEAKDLKNKESDKYK